LVEAKQFWEMLARIIAKTTEMALDALDSAGEQVAGSDHASQDSALAGQPGKSLRERLLLQQLDAAMQSEQYDEARVLQKELNMLSLPSQVGMRMMEHQQRVDMHRNMSVAVPKNNNLLTNVRSIADNALSSWRAISGAELKFVATPVKGGSAGDEGSEEPTPVTRLFRSEGSSTPARGGGAEAANSVPPTPVKDEFQDKMELMHLSLGTSPPDLQAAALCALRMVEIVGDEESEEGDDLRVEMASACYDKMEAALTEALHADPPSPALGPDSLLGALRLAEAAEAFGLDEHAAACVERCVRAEACPALPRPQSTPAPNPYSFQGGESQSLRSI